jgi:hypothetical protein
LKKLLLVILTVIVVVAAISTGVYAAVRYVINQDVTGTVAAPYTPPPSDTNEQVYLYTDSACNNVVSSLDFGTYSGGTASAIVYVKNGKMPTGGMEVTASGLPSGASIALTAGSPNSTSTPVTIILTGLTDSVSFSMNFHNVS